MLEYAEDRIKRSRAAPFSGWTLIATQHVQPSFIYLLDSLIRLGLDPIKCHIIPKLYSFDPNSISKLCERGVRIYADYRIEDSLASYERYAERQCYRALTKVASDNDSRLLVIDEGGRIGRCLARARFPDRRQIALVEQTTRGLMLHRGRGRPWPIVSVASSPIKRRDEAIYIAESMCDSIDLWLACLELPEIDASFAFLTVGYGAIGAAMSQALRHADREVVIVETDSVISEKATARGFSVFSSLQLCPVANRVVLGCTGTRAVALNELLHPTGQQIVVNCASSDTEFPAYRFREMSKEIDVLGNQIEQSCQLRRPAGWGSLHTRAFEDSWTALVNGGYPVNFHGQAEGADPWKIQLTRALVLFGAYQAIFEKRNGIVDLELSGKEVRTLRYMLGHHN